MNEDGTLVRGRQRGDGNSGKEERRWTGKELESLCVEFSRVWEVGPLSALDKVDSFSLTESLRGMVNY